MFLQICRAELRREIQFIRSYYLDFIGDQVLFILGFLILTGLFEILSDGKYSQSQRLVSLVGFLTWRVADGILIHTVDSIASDARWGLLEQLWLSPVSPAAILAARGLVSLASYLLRIFIIASILLPVLKVPLHISLSMIVIFLLAQIGIFGVSLMIVGTHMVYKQVASITLAFSTALLFVTGALVPLQGVRWLTLLAQLLPLGTSISLLQGVTLNHSTFTEILSLPLFYWLLCHTAAYLLAGTLFFFWGQRTARQKGQLSHY